MPKIKTKKSAVKRVTKITAKGKILRRKQLAQHLVHRKSRRSIKQSGVEVAFTGTQEKMIKKLIPYGE